MGTADDWAAEKYRQERRRWKCGKRAAAITVGGLVLFVTSFRVAAAALDRMCR